MINAENVHSVFRYDAESGKLYWKVDRGCAVKAGMELESVRVEASGNRYITLAYMGRRYLAHRIIWLMEYGEWPDVIDHVNGNGLDNRLENLRSITNHENQKNKRVYKSSKTKISGVNPFQFKFIANICINKKRFT